jgi:hypothetical protein
MPGLVLLVHGIRDFSRWQSEIEYTLERQGFTVELTNYGRMNLLKFLLPFPLFRRNAINEVANQIRHACELHNTDTLSIIAHSFGTHIVANILRYPFYLKTDYIRVHPSYHTQVYRFGIRRRYRRVSDEQIRFFRVIFCGSVLPYYFPFQRIRNKVIAHPIINEVGTRDPWPAVAESVTIGYGSAGTYGFRRPGIKDRFHNGAGHGFFLSASFCVKYWVPFLKAGAVIDGDIPGANPPFWVQFLSIFKIKYITTVMLIGMLGGGYYYGWLKSPESAVHSIWANCFRGPP